jgi:hypothetical protein
MSCQALIMASAPPATPVPGGSTSRTEDMAGWGLLLMNREKTQPVLKLSIAVGMPVTRHPCTDPDVRHYPIRLLPWVMTASMQWITEVSQRLACRTCVNAWDTRTRLCVRYV